MYSYLSALCNVGFFLKLSTLKCKQKLRTSIPDLEESDCSLITPSQEVTEVLASF